MCGHLGWPSPRQKATSADPEGTRGASREMLQVSFLLAPGSDLPVATALPVLPRPPPPRQGLQAP
jgi:hypothetical protein